MNNALSPLQARRQRLEDICYDPRVECIVTSPTSVAIGIPGQEAICRVVPCLNHRVKHPTAFIKTNGRYDLVSFVFREDIYALKGPRGGDTELDIFEPIIHLLKLDLNVKVVAYGYRGSTIVQNGFDELTLQIEATPIARMHYVKFPPRGSVKAVCRGLTFYITVPDSESPNEFEEFAQAVVPSFVAVSWSKERARRDEMRKTG